MLHRLLFLMFVCFDYHRHTDEGGGGGSLPGGSAPPPAAPTRNLKKKQIFSDTMSLEVKRDLRFSLNEPLKSADN
jgi:hypothetical protein